MAGDWIKMRNDLSDDPAVIAIASKLGMDEFAVIGRLHALWAWADEQSRDGHAAGVTGSWLDRKVQRDGFADALVSVKWLEVTPEGLTIPNFENHNGKTAKVRTLGTRRKQRQRAGNSPAVVPPSVPPTVPLVSLVPSRTVRDKSVTREEKRRVNKTSGVSDLFEEFWETWPQTGRKEAKGKCADLWKTKAFDGKAAAILAHVRSRAASPDWTKDGGQYVPAPLVYLRKEAWDGAELAEPAYAGGI